MNLGKDSITDKNRPCMNCPDRYPACSDHCKKPEFLAQKERNERLREARRREGIINGYTVDQVRKNKRVKWW